jgi:hypothetical protein
MAETYSFRCDIVSSAHENYGNNHVSGSLLLLRLCRMLPERELQKASFDVFTEQQQDNVESWQAMVKAYELDNRQPNPYELPKSGTCGFTVSRYVANGS